MKATIQKEAGKEKKKIKKPAIWLPKLIHNRNGPKIANRLKRPTEKGLSINMREEERSSVRYILTFV